MPVAAAKAVGVLGAAVQHHDQGQGPAGAAGGDIKPVGAGAGRISAGEGVKPARRWLHGPGPRGTVRGRCRPEGPRPGTRAAAGKPAKQEPLSVVSLLWARRAGGRSGWRPQACCRSPPRPHGASGVRAGFTQPGSGPAFAGSARLPQGGGPGGSGGWPQPSPPSGVRSWRYPFSWLFRRSLGQGSLHVARTGDPGSRVITAAQTMRAARTAFTAVEARKAPSTSTEAIAARASSGETSVAMSPARVPGCGSPARASRISPGRDGCSDSCPG